MDYQEAHHLIACHLPDMLPLFADGWSRWPAEAPAHQIITRAKSKAACWRVLDIDEALSATLDTLAEAIASHLPKVTTSGRAENTSTAEESKAVSPSSMEVL